MEMYLDLPTSPPLLSLIGILAYRSLDRYRYCEVLIGIAHVGSRYSRYRYSGMYVQIPFFFELDDCVNIQRTIFIFLF